MRKMIYLLIFALMSCVAVNANVGDTTWVYAHNVQLNYYNNFDSTVVFPNGSVSYRKIYMIMTLGEYNCTAGTQYCHQWDYDLENTIMNSRGDTLELSRFITPYATSGTPGFNINWKQHYIFDVTDYYNVLRDTGLVRVHYSGYSGGFTLNVKFAFIEGTPERNVIGIDRLWSGVYTYGNLTNVIDSNVKAIGLTTPANTQSAEMKIAITGHGSDNTSGCCEFDGSGIGHSYTVVANNSTVAQKNMNVNCGAMELYPQGGTWAYGRAGNWCPGSLVMVGQHKLTGVGASSPYTVDLNFDDSYDGGGSYGIYNISSSVFYYAGYNKALDASLEDIVAPTTFEWYHRENPRASAPVVKVRNTGSTTITSILFQYGVKDSTPSQYIWRGSLASLTDTIITLPALLAITNLSLGYSTGTFGFSAQILQVNGQQDNDASNDVLTSNFTVAPTWTSSFVVDMKTSSLGADGSFGSNPSDASWQITDENNAVVASRTNANYSTQYHDTVNLNAGGFYTLAVSTTQCVGLHWWALDGQSGYTPGSLVVRDINTNQNIPVNGNVYSGTYHDDFGCGFTQYFTTSGICQTDRPTITRNGNTLTCTSAISYQWYHNGVAINGATSSTYVMVVNDGNYTVMVTDGNGCTSNSATYAVINLGVNEIDLSSVSVAPNPTRDAFAITVSSELVGLPYILTDLTGRDILSGKLSNLSTSVSLSGKASGLYLLNVGGANGKSYKVIKN